MTLAKSQFFFLRNLSISSAANSCGSTTARLCLAKTTIPSVTRRLTSLKLPGLKAVKPQLEALKRRGFSTFAPRLNDTKRMSPELRAAAENFAEAMRADRASRPARRPLPLNSSKGVGVWLLASAGFVSAIVVLGGLTRLTESGLSITEWKPVTGSIPPLNQADWEAEYELYKNSPEFKILNTNMTLEEFKFIYYMEWTHRLWGRLLGVFFVLPGAYFVWARKCSGHTTKRLVLITGLIGLQGLIGWWMVKSGLNQDFLNHPNAHPRVSQYRLATHLGAAFLLYVAMIGTGVGILRESRWVKDPVNALKEFAQLNNPAVKPFRRTAAGLFVLVFFTAMTGAFVAGLDAGLIYNSFPYMGETIVPPSKELLDPIYASDKTSKWNIVWKNALENPTTVQFIHRCAAVTTYLAVFGVHLYSLRLRGVLPKSVIRSGGIAFGLVNLQAALGICTLIYVVPTPLASMHQAGAIALLTSVLILAMRLKLPRSTIQHLISVLASKSAKSGAASTASAASKVMPKRL